MLLTPDTVVNLAAAMLIVPAALSGLSFLALALAPARTRVKSALAVLTVAGAAGQLAMSLAMLAAPASAYPVTFALDIGLRIHFRIDALSLYFILLVNIVALAASWSTWAYLEQAPPHATTLQHPAFFHGSINGFHLTMLLVPMLDNLVALWIAMELTTLFSAFLVSHRGTRDAWEAAWKYLMITSAGIIIALLGTMLLANAVTSAAMPISNLDLSAIMNWSYVESLAMLDYLSDPFRRNLVTLAFLFILIGYGAKAGLAPMHTWLPDGHGEAPAPISALLSGVLLKCALYAVLRFVTITNLARGETTFTSAALLTAGLLSLMLAVPFILKRNRFKRVLAYHSLEHMGIITFGVGIGGSLALFGALFHCLNHAVTKALMFLSFGSLTRAYTRVLGREPLESEFTGALHAAPKTAVLLTLGGLALVGSPPFSVFMSELMILWGALGGLLKGQPAPQYTPLPAPVVAVAVALFLGSTTLIFYGLVRHLARIVMGRPPVPAGAPAQPRPAWKEQWSRDIFPVLLPAGLMLAFGVWLAPPLARLIAAGAAIVLAKP